MWVAAVLSVKIRSSDNVKSSSPSTPSAGQHPYLVTGATTQEWSLATNGHLEDCQAL